MIFLLIMADIEFGGEIPKRDESFRQNTSVETQDIDSGAENPQENGTNPEQE